MGRLLVISLDGYEWTLADALMSSGQLPSLARLRDQSARFPLDHGSAKLTGLAMEHVSSGLSPEDADRGSAIYFDRHSYAVWKEGALLAPFPSQIKSKTVIFDVPYFDLSKAPNVAGLTAWGAHDAGTKFSSNSEGLLDQLSEKFGSYPATEWIYGFAWPSAERCRAMGDALTRGVELRSKVALWLLDECFPDWEFGIIGVSEAHSVIEGLWHGIDEQHPLHHLPSSSAAGDGVRNVYIAIDRLIGDLTAAYEDATIVVFSMHGMGANHGDVPSMVLLPELLHRHAFGRPFFKQPDVWTRAPNGIPILGKAEHWRVETPEIGTAATRARDPAASRIFDGEAGEARQKSLRWMPGARYQPLWHEMPAFALPSFYDGQIRINLMGRERRGLVPLERYQQICQEIENLLKDCRNPVTGDGVVDSVEFTCPEDPLGLAPSGADLTVVWEGASLAFEHPRHGRIGPVPYRRTGGHTGLLGMAYLRGDDIVPGDRETRSSFDVVPTLIDLLGEREPSNISGHSMIAPETGRRSIARGTSRRRPTP